MKQLLKPLGKITLIEKLPLETSPSGKRLNRKAIYECYCGKRFTTTVCNVSSGNTKSCGCHNQNVKKSCNITHGDTGTPLYKRYWRMRSRCEFPSDKDYPEYGAKGITVSKDWDTYEKFKEWALKNGYQNDLSIDRIDGTKGYSPDNCRWANHYVQNINKTVVLPNKTGYTGVRVTISKTNPYSAAISINGVITNLGAFKTPEEASAAYEKARKKRDENYLKENLKK